MPLATFNPPIAPSPGSTTTPKIKLRTAEFGDGYTQEMPDGLNHIQRVINMKWGGLELAQAQAIEAFFVAQGGYKSFYYQPYGYASVLKWKCKEWSVSNSAPFAITAKLEQSFTTET